MGMSKAVFTIQDMVKVSRWIVFVLVTTRRSDATSSPHGKCPRTHLNKKVWCYGPMVNDTNVHTATKKLYIWLCQPNVPVAQSKCPRTHPTTQARWLTKHQTHIRAYCSDAICCTSHKATAMASLRPPEPGPRRAWQLLRHRDDACSTKLQAQFLTHVEQTSCPTSPSCRHTARCHMVVSSVSK